MNGFWNQLRNFFRPGIDMLKNLTSGQIFNSIMNKYTGAGLTGAEHEANQFTAQQAQEQRNWEEEMSNTAFQRQVADMQAAGVNPALAMTGGASGASTPSGSSATSVSPGAGADLLPVLFNYKLGRSRLDVEKDLREKELDIDQYNAVTRRLETESNIRRNTAYINNLAEVTRGLNISNNLAEALQDIKKRQAEASLDLTEAQVNQVNQTIEESSWRIGLIIAQTTSETMKTQLYHVEAMLKQLDVKDKAIYLMYADKLYSNQADSAYWQAQDDALQYAYDKKILTDDAAKATLDRLKAEGKIAGNAAYTSDITIDVIKNRNRPEKYSKMFSQKDWDNLRDGLIMDSYPSVTFSGGMTGFSGSGSRISNSGQFVK